MFDLIIYDFTVLIQQAGYTIININWEYGTEGLVLGYENVDNIARESLV